MSKQEKDPSEIISDFLNYIDQVRCDYKAAHDAAKDIIEIVEKGGIK